MRFLRLLRIIGLLAFALALQACSAVKIAYNQAPSLAYLYLDGYADFNDAQTLQVKAELDKFQTWHRQTQLPSYIQLLQKTQQLMPQDITDKQSCEIYSEIRQKALVMTDFAEPAVAKQAASLRPEQLAAMERKFAKSNTTWREDYLDGSAKDIAEKRQKSAIKRADMLYGSVNNKQRALIAQQVEKSQFKAAVSYAERERRQKDILQTLSKLIASQLSSDSVSKEMRSLLARSLASPDAAYRGYLEQVTQEACASFAQLHNTTTPEQRKKAVEVLAGYEQDFRILASQK